MSRLFPLQVRRLKKIALVLTTVVGVMIPLSTFAQSAGPERVINSNKLPFLREASGGFSSSTGTTNVTTPGEIVVVANPVKVQQGGLESQANNCRFRDISGHRSEHAINYLYDKGVVGGRTPCYYQPNSPVTRAEVTTMVVRATETEVPKSPTPAAFTDTNVQSWSAKHVKAAKNANIVHGYPDGNFRAEKPANVVETLKITTRGFDADFSDIDFARLSEVKDIALDQWYVKYVQAGFDEGLILDSAVYIAPASEVTRAEAAEIVYILMTKREEY